MICNKKTWKDWQVYYQLLFAILIGFIFFSVVLSIQYIYIIVSIVMIIYFLSFIKYQSEITGTNIYQKQNLWKFYFYPIIGKIINIVHGKCRYQAPINIFIKCASSICGSIWCTMISEHGDSCFRISFIN